MTAAAGTPLELLENQALPEPVAVNAITQWLRSHSYPAPGVLAEQFNTAATQGALG